jgi:TonB family protein
MSDLAAAPPGSERWLPGPKPPDEGWTPKKFTLVLLFVLAFHVALVCLLGTRRQILPRAATNVPRLQLANNANEFIALGDPTLFARPNAHDLVTAYWRQLPASTRPNFDWPAPPGFLTNASANLGTMFRDFIQNSRPSELPLHFKPEPQSTLPDVAGNGATPQTTRQIAGELAYRPLVGPKAAVLPSLPRNDVLGPSTVLVLVDAAGNVASAVVVEPNTAPEADQLALQLVRNLRFAPAPHLTFGEISFTWHTVPLLNTNEPSH